MCNFIQERAYILHGDSFTYQKFNKNPIVEKIDFTAKEQRKDKPKLKHVRVDQKPLHHPPSEPGSLPNRGALGKEEVRPPCIVCLGLKERLSFMCSVNHLFFYSLNTESVDIHGVPPTCQAQDQCKSPEASILRCSESSEEDTYKQ